CAEQGGSPMFCPPCRGLFVSLMVFLAVGAEALAQAPLPGAQETNQATSDDALRKALSERYDDLNQSIASRQISTDEVARVLLELLVLADVVGDRATSDEIRIRLILDYPATISARYLVIQF